MNIANYYSMNRDGRRLQLDDFLKNRMVSDVQIDEKERFAVYTLMSADRKDNCRRRSLYLLPLDTFKPRRFALPFEPESFSISQGEILCSVAENGSTAIYACAAEGGKPRLLCPLPLRILRFARTDRHIYFTAAVESRDHSGGVRCSTVSPFYEEGRGVVGSGAVGLFRSDLEGREIAILTAPDMDVEQVDFDPRLGRVVFNAYTRSRTKTVESAVYLYDMNTAELRLLCAEPMRISTVISFDRNRVLFSGVDLRSQRRNDNHRHYCVDLRDGSCAEFADTADLSNETPGIVTDSYFSSAPVLHLYDGKLYCKQVGRDRELLLRISSDGTAEKIETGLTMIGSFRAFSGGIIAAGMRAQQLSELYLIPDISPRGEKRRETRQLTDHNSWTEEVCLSVPQRFTAEHGGVQIDGFLYPPSGAREESPSRTAALVLMIHGGPKMLYSDVYSHDIQLLCASGCYVLCTNPMGSDGRGDAFADIRGSFAELPFAQLMKSVDTLLQQNPEIDPARLGVTGGSYGGYMTNYIITRTGRFAAAVCERGISSLMSSFTTSDIGYQFVSEYLDTGSPGAWASPAAIMEDSPLCRADTVTTPTLFIHGENDYRCCSCESLAMFNALNYHGVDTRFCLFSGEGHGLTVRGKPAAKQRRYQEMTGWFTRYLALKSSEQTEMR